MQRTARTARSPEIPLPGTARGVFGRAVGRAAGGLARGDRPVGNPAGGPARGTFGRLGGLGGCPQVVRSRLVRRIRGPHLDAPERERGNQAFEAAGQRPAVLGPVPVRVLGIPDALIEHGETAASVGIAAGDIRDAVADLVRARRRAASPDAPLR